MRVFWAVVVFSCALVLSGCSGMPAMVSNPSNPFSNSGSGAAIHGVVHGGQNPISGSHVYLYAVGDTGYGGAAVSVLNNSVLTQTPSGGFDGTNYYVTSASDGTFTVTGDYVCPTSGSYPELYLLASGGNPTGSGSVNNTAITLLAPLGDCSQPGFAAENVVVNEVSTVATVYAASSVITDLTHVSAPPPTDTLALTALGNIDTSLLYDAATGGAISTTPAGNGAVPQAEIDTLANLLAACVNTTSASSANCQTLFNNAKNGSVAPTDTASAAFNIGRNPGANIANLFPLQAAAGAPFVPDLSSAPNDFAIAITYTGGGLASPGGIVIDASGNAWISNNGAHSISELGSDGTVISGSSGFTGGGLAGPFGIAIDANGNVWTANPGQISGVNCNCISKFNSNGIPLSPSTGFTGGGLTVPMGITIDASAHVWVSNTSVNSLSRFNVSDGSVLSGSPISTGGLNAPIQMVTDSAGNVWASNSGSGTLSEFDSSGVANGSSPFGGGNLSNPRGLAVDASNNVWVASRGNSVLGEFNSTGAVTSSGYTGGGISTPNYVAIDSAANVWVVNHVASGSISRFDSSGTALTGSTGYTGWLPPAGGSALNNPAALAIDGAGDIWVTNGGNNTVVEFIGLASPVATPIVANLLAPYGSHAVNKP